jgi:putative membrane protein
MYLQHTLHMLLETILSIILGVAIGTFSGLIPGLHVNIVCTLVLAYHITITQHIEQQTLVILVLCIGLTHTIIDSITSTITSVPSDNAFILTPAQELTKNGQMHTAMNALIVGSYTSAIISCILFIPILQILPWLNSTVKPYIAYAILAIIAVLILIEKKPILIATIYCLSGLVGVAIFALPLNQPITILLCGLFTIPAILETVPIPRIQQTQQTVNIDLVGSTLSSIAGLIGAFLPGIGSSQMSILISKWYQCKTQEQLLFVTAGINTASFISSIATMSTLGVARNGVIATIGQLTQTVQLDPIGCCVLIISCTSLAVGIALALAPICITLAKNIPQKAIKIAVGIICLTIVFVCDSTAGIVYVLLVSTLGILFVKLQVPRHYAMGCLMIPTLLFYFA